MPADLLSWKMWLVALFAFGFGPRLILRVVVHAWPEDDGRRRETLAALEHVSYARRPLFVAEQIEAALVDGLWPRIRRQLRRRTSSFRGIFMLAWMVGSTFGAQQIERPFHSALWSRLAATAAFSIVAALPLSPRIYRHLRRLLAVRAWRRRVAMVARSRL